MTAPSALVPAHPAAPDTPTMAAFVQAVRRALHDWLPLALAECAASLEPSRLQRVGTPAERLRLAELGTRTRAQSSAWSAALAQAIGQAIDDDLHGRDDDLQGRDSGSRPGAAEPDALSLMDEAAIDEDIALSRLVQTAELQAEASLRELAARCSRLRGLPAVLPDAHPMRPAVVARGLRRAVAGFGLDAASRLDLLRALAPATGERLAPEYARQLTLLSGWGVEPSRFQLRDPLAGGSLRPFGGAPGATPGGAPGSRPSPVGQPLPDASPAPTPPPRQLTHGALQRLAVGQPNGGGPPPAETMARLLAVLLSRSGLTDGARGLIRRLETPARRLAVTEPALWQSPDHPLWQLLDRLMSAGAVLGDTGLTQAGRAGAELEAAVQRLEQTDPPDPSQLQAAVTAVDDAASWQLGAEAERVAPQAEQMQAALARDEIEARVREQVVEQLRQRPLPAGLRQFLVGPWATALSHSAHAHGFDSPQFRAQVAMLEPMLDLCVRPRTQPLAADVYTRCMTHARLGLVDAGFPEARVEAELADLGRTLRKPWHDAVQAGTGFDDAAPAAWATPAAPGAGSGAAADPPEAAATDALGLHDALATVPIDMGLGGDADPRARAACEAWLGSLEPGMLCRLFLQGRWANAQLVWRSLDRSMFVFGGRQAGTTHTLARPALHKLRAAGLAATIERGQFIAQALGELARDVG